MFIARNLKKHCPKTLSSLILNSASKNSLLLRVVSPKYITSNVIQSSFPIKNVSFSSIKPLNCFDGSRGMSTSRGRSMRSKVESRMRKESGKTLREIRRAKKLKKKLMTDEERLIYNLRRAKKKVALLLQKLKKYELPELPSPRHDPELFTVEQLQAYKKIGFRNKNYVPVGVRGVFGGVVQNMHLHWKFHETVQVCCDIFPKEKIKEMATMLARLSGGIVVNIHNVKTIIMFRGRNYRQPKNLIPINTLTKRKALFKARFEQALESQKLNIKKIEQQLRRMGVNPDDPVAMASIQRVASTFFNAIDKKDGSPYVFQGDKQTVGQSSSSLQQSEPAEDSDQEELDKFIAEIEDAADKEWAAEEAAEKAEVDSIRYWNKEDLGGRFRRSELTRNQRSDDENRGRAKTWKDTRGWKSVDNSDDEDDNIPEDNDEWESNDVADVSDHETGADDTDDVHDKFNLHKVEKWKQDKVDRANNNAGFRRNTESKFKVKNAKEDAGSEDMLNHLEDAMWESDNEEEQQHLREPRAASYNYVSSSDEEKDYHQMKRSQKNGEMRVQDLESDDEESHNELNVSRGQGNRGRHGEATIAEDNSGSDDLFSDSEIATWQSDPEDDDKNEVNKRKKSPKQFDETWDSD